MILLLAAATRVLLVAGASPGELTNQDSAGYLGSAAALEEAGRFTLTPESDVPMFFRTPGYPLFLAALRAVAGESVKTLAAGQALLSVLIALGVFVLARWWWSGWTVPLLAAAAAAFEPLQMWSATQIGTESLASASYVAVALGATWASRRASAWSWAVVGLLIAAATFVRPSTYYFPIVLAAGLFVGFRLWDRWPGWRRSAIWVLALLVPCVLSLGAWQLRNHRAVDSWRFSAVEGINMYEYRAAGVVAEETGRPFGAVRREFQEQFQAAHPFVRQGPATDAMFDEGREIVTSHPLTFVRVTLAGTVSIVWGVRHGLYPLLDLESSSWTDAVARVGLVVFYGFTAFGMIRVLRGLRHDEVAPAHVVTLLLVAYVLLVSSGPESSARLRAPLTPLLGIYFASGLVAAGRWLRTRWPRTTEAAEPAPATAVLDA